MLAKTSDFFSFKSLRSAVVLCAASLPSFAFAERAGKPEDNVWQDFEKQSSGYILQLESESFTERENASKEMLQFLLQTEERFSTIPEESLKRLGIGMDLKERFARFDPESAIRLTALEREFNYYRPQAEKLLLEGKPDYQQLVKRVEEEYGIEIRDHGCSDHCSINLNGRDGLSFAEAMAEISAATRSVPYYEGNGKKVIRLEKTDAETVNYFSTSIGLFILCNKAGSVEIHALTDPKAAIVSFEDLKAPDHTAVQTYSGYQNPMIGNVHTDDSVTYDPDTWIMHDNEISVKVWMSRGQKKETIDFRTGTSSAVGDSLVRFSLLKNQQDRICIRQEIDVFPRYQWDDTGWGFDALSTLHAGICSYRFLDSDGKELEWESENLSLSSRTIGRDILLSAIPSKVEITSYGLPRQHILNFSMISESAFLECQKGIQSILTADGAGDNKDLPNPLRLVKSY